MDNVSHALLIAGGILLTLLILSSVVIMSNNIQNIGTAQAERKEQERLKAWNAEWEAYDKRLLYGAEVLTVVNKSIQNNIDYQYKVEILIEGTDAQGVKITTGNISNYKKSIFECTNIEYNTETGRVKLMEFELMEDFR